MIPYRTPTQPPDLESALRLAGFGMDEEKGREFAAKEAIKALVAYERERNQRRDWIFG